MLALAPPPPKFASSAAAVGGIILQSVMGAENRNDVIKSKKEFRTS
jgi:hypothetical protein